MKIATCVEEKLRQAATSYMVRTNFLYDFLNLLAAVLTSHAVRRNPQCVLQLTPELGNDLRSASVCLENDKTGSEAIFLRTVARESNEL